MCVDRQSYNAKKLALDAGERHSRERLQDARLGFAWHRDMPWKVCRA